MNTPKVTLYTDGSWRGKTRTGGYAAFLTDEWGNCMLVGEGFSGTTISRMELSAVLAGLSRIHDGCDVTVISDSQYVVNVINKWLSGWMSSGYVKSNGDTVSNTDIIRDLAAHISRMSRVTAIWVKAHTNYSDEQSMCNSLCDYFAVQQAMAIAR